MSPRRKSVDGITERALKKCSLFYRDAVVAYCTPAEFLALCWYFESTPRPHEYEYYLRQVKSGVCNPTTHYLHVKKWKTVFSKNIFPVNRYACLDIFMSREDK